MTIALKQFDLFARTDPLPDGFRYQAEFIDEGDERTLVNEMEKLSFTPFQFQGFEGKREVLSFGWRYDFNGGGLQRAGDIPPFLFALRERAARFAKLQASDLVQTHLLKYPPGAGIGWHKDRPVFGDVIGISLSTPCAFRFRRNFDQRWQRRSLTAEPRSAYVLHGPSRDEWEHSISSVSAERYSITFRSLRKSATSRHA